MVFAVLCYLVSQVQSQIISQTTVSAFDAGALTATTIGVGGAVSDAGALIQVNGAAPLVTLLNGSSGFLRFTMDAGGNGIVSVSGAGGANLTLAANGAIPILFRSGNAYQMDLTATGNLEFRGAAPTVATGAGDCGTGPAIVGNNKAGRVTVGTVANGGICTLTLTAAFTNAPQCSCSNVTAAARVCQAAGTATTTVILRAMTTFTAGDLLSYHCVGYI